MEKIVIEFEPTLNDYVSVVRSFQTRKRTYWIALGIYSVVLPLFLVISVMSLFDKDLQYGLYLLPVSILMLFGMSYPLWSGWLMIRNATKREHLTLPTKYELDDEKLIVVNQKSEGKYDWSVFSQIYDDGRYIMIGYSTNKNMFHFIPKRAFTSVDQELLVRELVTRRIGKIEEIRRGLTGWKMSVLTAFLFLALLTCVVGAIALLAILFQI